MSDTMAERTTESAGLSIVCVFNDASVRKECLDDSIAAYRGPIDIDYIPIDNMAQAFSTAGAALNHGVSLARHDVVVFAHQDVYLNSVDRLAQVASFLDVDDWALLGANGVTGAGENVGRIQDRVQLIGRSAPTPIDVDSLDEVLFMARRSLLTEHRLSEELDLAWHAYAVEYSLRLRKGGLRVGAVDMGATHNSLTTNLAKLDVAHEKVGHQYPEYQPIHTTCGTIGRSSASLRQAAFIRRHGWRIRWLRHSLVALQARARLSVPTVLSDIRHEVDMLNFSTSKPLHLLNVDRVGGFGQYAVGEVSLTRYNRPVVMRTESTIRAAIERLDEIPTECAVLIIGLDLSDLRGLRRRCTRQEGWLLGIHPDTLWLLRLARGTDLPQEWEQPAAVPLGSRAINR